VCFLVKFEFMKYLFFLCIIFFINILSAQYNITVKIKNLPPQKVQFAYYFEDKQYVVAEAESDAKGVVKFKGDNHDTAYLKIPIRIYSTEDCRPCRNCPSLKSDVVPKDCLHNK